MSAEAFAEVVGNPYAVWVSPVGTAAPTIDDTEQDFDPAWIEFGTNGTENQGTEGVTVNLAETIASFRPAGGTLNVKDWRTAEDPTVTFSVVDTSVEQLALVLDDAAITTQSATTGHAGQKSISLIRGVAVHYFALLVRGISPYDDGSGMNAQYEFARVCQTGSQSLKYVLGTPADVACEFSIRGTVNGDDPALYRAQNAART